MTASDKIDTLNVHRENKIQNSSQYDAFNNAGAIENVEDVHQPLNIVVNEKADPKKSVSEFDFNNDGEPDVPSDLQEDEDDAQFYDPVTGENTNRTPIYKFGNKIRKLNTLKN